MSGKSSMRTPLGRVRGKGSAHGGTEHFWHQRVTAAALAPLVIVFLVVMLSLSGSDHAGVVAGLGQPLVAVLMIAMVLALVWHMRLGMQVIIEDYVRAEGTKIALLVANTLFSGFIAVAAVFALLKIALGG